MPTDAHLVLKCFPSLLPHTWLRRKHVYQNTISSIPSWRYSKVLQYY